MLVAYKSPVCSRNGVSKKGLAGLQFPSANGVVTRSNRALRGKGGPRSAAKRPSQETHAPAHRLKNKSRANTWAGVN